MLIINYKLSFMSSIMIYCKIKMKKYEGLHDDDSPVMQISSIPLSKSMVMAIKGQHA